MHHYEIQNRQENKITTSAHMHLFHKLGNTKTEANYHAYYQTLIKDGTANGATQCLPHIIQCFL